MRLFFCIFTLCLAPLLLHAEDVRYTVEFEGLQDGKALKAIKSVSQLNSLKKRPPASMNALRYRAESDIPALIQVLHVHGYYEAQIDTHIEEVSGRISVIVMIDPGPAYPLEAYQIHLFCEQAENSASCCAIPLESIDVHLGKPALTKNILNAELNLLQKLSECGYPLAQIKKREVIVDGKTQSVRVDLFVDSGEKAFFGPDSVIGTKRVNPLYIQRKLEWTEGEEYNSELVEKTQSNLIASGLFNSVLITHGEDPYSNGELPMKIEVNETKHQSVNVGVSYQTVFGPGITFGWENRNVAGMGRRLSFQGDVTFISQTGVATYLHPDFFVLDQDYIWRGEAEHEALFAYSMRSYNLMNRVDRRFGKRIRLGMGLQGERLFITASKKQNGEFWLAEIPLYVRFSTANDLLDPTKGVVLEGTLIPSINIRESTNAYFTQTISESSYFPLNKSRSVVIAQKLTLGMTWSDSLEVIPLSKRFLGGSEEDLRGYRYRTVSPLLDNKPIGGRSAVYFTLETRLRVSKAIGLVPFFDVGNVYSTLFPTWDGKWLKSTGLGIRYFSFMGPFRLDVAFPLNRRKGIDPVYKILVSIGQTF